MANEVHIKAKLRRLEERKLLAKAKSFLDSIQTLFVQYECQSVRDLPPAVRTALLDQMLHEGFLGGEDIDEFERYLAGGPAPASKLAQLSPTSKFAWLLGPIQ